MARNLLVLLSLVTVVLASAFRLSYWAPVHGCCRSNSCPVCEKEKYSSVSSECEWSGSAPFCGGSCGGAYPVQAALSSIPFRPHSGSVCWTGSKALCCRPTLKNCDLRIITGDEGEAWGDKCLRMDIPEAPICGTITPANFCSRDNKTLIADERISVGYGARVFVTAGVCCHTA